MTASIMPIDTPEATSDALRGYEMAADDHARATIILADIRYELTDMEQHLSDAEAEIVANGGWADHEITGSNESARKASAAACIAAHPRIKEAREAIREKRRQLALNEAAQAEAVNAMRLYRLHVDWATAWSYRVAAIEGRLPVEARRYGNGNQ